jgi:hypothetical protein
MDQIYRCGSAKSTTFRSAPKAAVAGTTAGNRFAATDALERAP